jgi:hypothetical protein
MALEIAQELWSLILTHFVNLSELAIVEQDVIAAAVNALNVHAKSHDNLEVRVLGLVISHPHLHCFVGNLDHLKVVLHLLLQNGVIQNDRATLMDTSKDLLVAAPLELKDGATLTLNAWHSLPTIAVSWALGGELLALPHHDETVFGSTRNDPSLGVVLNGYNLVIENLVFEARLCECEDIVLIILNIKHPNHVFSRDSGQETLPRPNGGKIVNIATNCELDFAVGHQFLRQVELELDQEQVGGDDDDRVLLLVE